MCETVPTVAAWSGVPVWTEQSVPMWLSYASGDTQAVPDQPVQSAIEPLLVFRSLNASIMNPSSYGRISYGPGATCAKGVLGATTWIKHTADNTRAMNENGGNLTFVKEKDVNGSLLSLFILPA